MLKFTMSKNPFKKEDKHPDFQFLVYKGEDENGKHKYDNIGCVWVKTDKKGNERYNIELDIEKAGYVKKDNGLNLPKQEQLPGVGEEPEQEIDLDKIF